MSTINLVPMEESDFERFYLFSQKQYAEEKMKREGLAKEEAYKLSEESFKNLLPQGHKTPDQFLYQITCLSKQSNIGFLWFGKRSEHNQTYAYVWDFYIAPEFRGKGHGKQTMQWLENKVRELGLQQIRLHVFGSNQVARKLYQQEGFIETNVVMRKDLY